MIRPPPTPTLFPSPPLSRSGCHGHARHAFSCDRLFRAEKDRREKSRLSRCFRRLRRFSFWNRNRATVHHFAHARQDRKSTRLNSSHLVISYAVFCLKKTTRT